jgi:hypothetical protein
MQLPIVEIGHSASNAAEKECSATRDRAERGTRTLRGALTKGTSTVCHTARFKLGHSVRTLWSRSLAQFQDRRGRERWTSLDCRDLEVP